MLFCFSHYFAIFVIVNKNFTVVTMICSSEIHNYLSSYHPIVKLSANTISQHFYRSLPTSSFYTYSEHRIKMHTVSTLRRMRSYLF